MRKKRTSGRPLRLLRQGLAIFTAAAALWLIWLTANPAALTDQLRQLAGDPALSLSLLQAELGVVPEGRFSFLDRLVLAQSALLTATPAADLLTPPNIPDAEAPADNNEAK